MLISSTRRDRLPGHADSRDVVGATLVGLEIPAVRQECTPNNKPNCSLQPSPTILSAEHFNSTPPQPEGHPMNQEEDGEEEKCGNKDAQVG